MALVHDEVRKSFSIIADRSDAPVLFEYVIPDGHIATFDFEVASTMLNTSHPGEYSRFLGTAVYKYIAPDPTPHTVSSLSYYEPDSGAPGVPIHSGSNPDCETTLEWDEPNHKMTLKFTNDSLTQQAVVVVQLRMVVRNSDGWSAPPP